MKGDIETFHRDGRWHNKTEGNERATNSWDTKEEAQAEGRRMAIDRGVEHVIKKEDGTIGEKNTYPRSSDPRDIPG